MTRPRSREGLTKAEFDEQLHEVVGELTTTGLLAITSVYVALSEHFNDEVIERLEAEKYMTEEDAVEFFRTEHLPDLIRAELDSGREDWPRRRQSWNDYVDRVQKDGLLSEEQAANMTQPDFVKEAK